MARLGSVAQALYVPTPPQMTELIARSINVVGPGRLLDPCAGEGEAAATLAERWGLEAYGVELHAGRAAKAAQRLPGRTLHGSYHQLVAAPGSFQALYLNPPYDEGLSADGNGTRQEIQFLTDCAGWLAPSGLLVAVLPSSILVNERFASALRYKFQEIEVYRFPDPEFAAYKQVVVVAVKNRGGSYACGYYNAPERLAVLGDGENGRYRDGAEIDLPTPPAASPTFTLFGENPHDLAPTADTGCYATPAWALLTGQNDATGFTRPLAEPRPGHVAMLLAAGSLNGTEIVGGKLVKGLSRKVDTEITDVEAETVTVRQRVVSQFSVLDLTTGEVEQWRADEDEARTRAWFAENGAALVNAVRRDHPAVFEARDVENYDFSDLRAPGLLPGKTKPEILTAQKTAAAAIVRCWRDHGQAVLSGEMGVGKTSVSVAACALAGFRKTIIVCPTHLVPKWMREVDTITGKPTARTATKLSDIDAFFADPAARFLILSKERAKLGTKWRAATKSARRTITREIKNPEYTVDCYKGYSHQRPETITVTGEIRVHACPRCLTDVLDGDGVPAGDDYMAKDKRACVKCGEALWSSVALSEKGTTRWPLAAYIARRYSKKYALVLDECHDFSGADSDQGRAAQQLCTHAKRILAMTGTLYGGRASSIFYLLYRLDPTFRQMYRHSECSRFVAEHGLFETIHKMDEYTSRYGRRRNNTGGRVREIPGIHPAMINLLLPYTVFVRLKDLGYELPPLTEEVRVINHAPEVAAAASRLQRDAHDDLRKNPQILGQYIMACLGYPDCPEHAERIATKPDYYGSQEVFAEAPAFASQPWPKDMEVARIALAEKAAGLQTLVFFTQTHKRSPIPRVKSYLESRGLRVVVLDSSVAAGKREEWLRKAERGGGFDVMLTNGRLVETGLDLLFATTIIQYGVEFSVKTLRQSTRRSWRLGQSRSVQVIMLAYAGTLQAAGVNLVARKMRAAETLDGDELGGIALHDESGHDVLMELARETAARHDRAA